MDTVELREQLTALSKLRSQKLAELDSAETASLARRQQLVDQLRTLESSLSEVTSQLKQLKENRHLQRSEFASFELSLFAEALDSTNKLVRSDFARADQLLELERRRNDLFAADAVLLEDWKSVQEFEANRETILAGIPKAYQPELLAKHKELRTRVQPVLDLGAQIEEIQAGGQVEITCALFHNLDTAELSLALPVNVNELAAEDEESQKWRKLVEQVEAALFDMGKLKTWELLDLSFGNWAGFVTIETLAEYSGEESIAESCLTAIARHASQSGKSALAAYHWDIVPISAEAWQSAEHSALADAPGIADTEADEAVPEPAADVQTEAVQVGDGWYTEKDLQSWMRPVRVSAESKWSRPARLLRTMLIRMIGKGNVGQNQVAATSMWMGLPASLDAYVQDQVPELIDRGFLLSANGSNGDGLISINPEFLDEAQSLVNRTITPFWDEVIGDSDLVVT